jgi:hypothetical protein
MAETRLRMLLLCLVLLSLICVARADYCNESYQACLAPAVSGMQQCETSLAAQCNYDLSYYGASFYPNTITQGTLDKKFSCKFTGDNNIDFHPKSSCSADTPCYATTIQNNWQNAMFFNKCKQYNDIWNKCGDEYLNCQISGMFDNGTNPSPTNSNPISIVEMSGEVEYREGASGPFKPLTKDVTLRQGMYVSTGFESSVTVNIDGQLLRVPQITQFRFDEFTQGTNLVKTQMFLNVGAIEARVKHTAAIRSDFSVVTPTAIASIRGSEMVVTYDNSTNTTAVYAISDVAYVKGNGDSSEIAVNANQTATVGSSGKATAPVSFSNSELPADLRDYTFPEVTSPPQNTCCISLLILAVVFAGAYYSERMKH